MVYKAPALYSGQMDQAYLSLSPLPAHIIDEIRKREKKKKERTGIPLRLPLPMDPPQKIDEKEEEDRGVIIIDLGEDHSIDSII